MEKAGCLVEFVLTAIVYCTRQLVEHTLRFFFYFLCTLGRSLCQGRADVSSLKESPEYTKRDFEAYILPQTYVTQRVLVTKCVV